jgi:acetaldehyde dehydrogenase / alcohol dehydrogenase
VGTQMTLQEWRDRAIAVTSAERIDEVDAAVARAATAARDFRRLDQDQVDRIVWAMTVAGLEAATELAVLATEETQFGVLEDKVIKNYVATEFLYDYLKDKRTVGVIERDRHAGIDIVAEPIGVVSPSRRSPTRPRPCCSRRSWRPRPATPSSSAPPPCAIRCAERVVESSPAAGEAAGLPPGALQVVPDREHEVSHYLWRHDDVDLTWTTGGPGVVRAANQAGKPSISVSSGNAPFYVHRSADLGMAVVDLLISKTFDASVICPAEQTAIVDDPVYDEFLAELQRLGGAVLPRRGGPAPRGDPSAATARWTCRPSAVRTRTGRPARGRRAPDHKVLLAPLPTDLDELAAHPLVREKLMPVLGLVRSPDVEHGVAAAVVVTEHGGLGHTSAVYARDEEPS